MLLRTGFCRNTLVTRSDKRFCDPPIPTEADDVCRWNHGSCSIQKDLGTSHRHLNIPIDVYGADKQFCGLVPNGPLSLPPSRT